MNVGLDDGECIRRSALIESALFCRTKQLLDVDSELFGWFQGFDIPADSPLPKLRFYFRKKVKHARAGKQV